MFLSLFGPESHVIIQADTNAEQEMNVAGASGQESKNLVKTNDDTEMKEYSDNNKTTDQNDAVKNNVHWDIETPIYLLFLDNKNSSNCSKSNIFQYRAASSIINRVVVIHIDFKSSTLKKRKKSWIYNYFWNKDVDLLYFSILAENKSRLIVYVHWKCIKKYFQLPHFSHAMGWN